MTASSATVDVGALPEQAIAASSAFHMDWMHHVAEALSSADCVAVVFPTATYDHRDWRVAAIRDLARQHAPKRINGVGGGSIDAREHALHYLAGAPGVTGQYLELDGNARP